MGAANGQQFTTGGCTSDADCQSACCAGNPTLGVCSAEAAALQAGKTGCGFVDPNATATSKLNISYITQLLLVIFRATLTNLVCTQLLQQRLKSLNRGSDEARFMNPHKLLPACEAGVLLFCEATLLTGFDLRLCSGSG